MTCDKCMGTDIAVSYHLDEYGQKGCRYGSFTKRATEHLHYHCRCCGYDWVGDIAHTQGPSHDANDA